MKRIIVSCTVAAALFAGGFAVADSDDPATTNFAGSASAVTGTSGVPAISPGSGADSAPDANRAASGAKTGSTSTNDQEMKACLVRKKSGDHSMSRSDRERACSAEIEENAAQP